MRPESLKSSELHCECADAGCRVHLGKSQCDGHGPWYILERIDMDDESGTRFCPWCTVDAIESGVFAFREMDEEGSR